MWVTELIDEQLFKEFIDSCDDKRKKKIIYFFNNEVSLKDFIDLLRYHKIDFKTEENFEWCGVKKMCKRLLSCETNNKINIEPFESQFLNEHTSNQPIFFSKDLKKKYPESKIIQFHSKIKGDNILKLLSIYQKKTEKSQELNSTLKVVEPKLNKKSDVNNLLYGVPYSLKDLYITSGITSTGGSLLYKNFIPNYDAKAYSLLLNSGAILLGKDSCDEFGFGGSGCECYSNLIDEKLGLVYSNVKPVLNCKNKRRTTLGSSSGSCNKVANNEVVFALSTDTADSARVPACLTGVYGYKPTYGLISRYGIYSYSNIFDTPSIISQSVCDSAIIANAIVAYDENDMNSQCLKTPLVLPKELKNIKVAYFTPECLGKFNSKKDKTSYKSCLEIKDKWDHIVSILSNEINIKQVNIDIDDKLIQDFYKAWCYIDGMSNRAKDIFDLKTYEDKLSFMGDYYDIARANRKEKLSFDLRRKIIQGALFCNYKHGEIVNKIQEIRKHIIHIMDNIFNQYDAVIIPSVGSIAPLYKKGELTYLNNNVSEYLKIANITGIPSITIPTGKVQKMPWGICINSNRFEDQKVLDIAYTIEKILKKGGIE